MTGHIKCIFFSIFSDCSKNRQLMRSVVKLMESIEERCPLCYTEFSFINPPLMICTAQHCVCESCCQKLELQSKKCPECRQTIRNFSLIKIFMKRCYSPPALSTLIQLTFAEYQQHNKQQMNDLLNIHIINSVFHFYDREYESAKNIISKIKKENKNIVFQQRVENSCIEEFDPIMKRVLKLKGTDLFDELYQIYDLQEIQQANFRKQKSIQYLSGSKQAASKINQTSDLPFLQLMKDLNNIPQDTSFVYSTIMFYALHSGQQKSPWHLQFFKKCRQHERRDIQIMGSIGMLIYYSISKQHRNCLFLLHQLLDDYDFCEHVNNLGNNNLIDQIRRSISYPLNKLKIFSEWVGFARKLQQISRVIKLEDMLLIAERSNNIVWYDLALRHFPNVFDKIVVIARNFYINNQKMKSLQVYNYCLKSDMPEEKRKEILSIIKQRFRKQEEWKLLKSVGCFRGIHYHQIIRQKWKLNEL